MPFWIWVAFGEYPTLRVFAGGALVMGAVIADIVGDMRSQRKSSRNTAIETARISHPMKIGDRVEVIAVPQSLPSGMGTQELFESCLGRSFSIEDIDDAGLIELHVGEVVGEESYMHSIWIEAGCVRPRPNDRV
jgi:hypothetical protein